MYNGQLKLHPADSLFLATFLLVGTGVGALVYFGHEILLDKALGLGILVFLAGLALWYRQR